jgi:Tfp pilus assembly protein PilE
VYEVGMSRRVGRKGDQGFTLLELVVSTAITGVVAITISAAIAVVMRSSPVLATAINDAQNQALLLNYFDADVGSTPPTGVDLSSNAAGCWASGVNVLQLTRNDGAITRRVSYRLTWTSTQATMIRQSCTVAADGSVLASRPATVARGLQVPPGGWTGGAPAKVSVSSGVVTIQLSQTSRVLVVSARLGQVVGVLP